jgi:site-specific recombinase XerD
LEQLEQLEQPHTQRLAKKTVLPPSVVIPFGKHKGKPLDVLQSDAAYRLVRLLWDQIDFPQGLLHVIRLKRGVPSVHPLSGEELRALRRLRREQSDGRHVFQTERKAPMTEAGFRKTLARIGEASELSFPVHPHMLRHGTGYKLANDGRDTRALQHYLGHRNIQHTTRYTELASGRFEGWWE